MPDPRANTTTLGAPSKGDVAMSIAPVDHAVRESDAVADHLTTMAAIGPAASSGCPSVVDARFIGGRTRAVVAWVEYLLIDPAYSEAVWQ